MLSEIERIFPNMRSNRQIDIDQIATVRKNRSKLFNEQYFTNRFWDIILLLYAHEINDLPIDANGISRNLDLNHRAVMRYLKVLLADDIIDSYDPSATDRFNLACDNLSLTRQGFENAGIIVQQTRKALGASTAL